MGTWVEARSREMSALRHGTLILTVSERAASALRREYDERERASGRALWEPPAIRSWASWLEGQWRDLLLTGRAQALLLNRTQEHALWRSVIAQDSGTIEPAALDRLGEMAAAAWRVLCAYRGQHPLHTTPRQGSLALWPMRSADTDAFARWSAIFIRRCDDEGLLSVAVLEEALAKMFSSGTRELRHARLALSGFGEVTPAQAWLLKAYQRAGGVIDRLPQPSPAEHAGVLAATNSTEELTSCASWCRAELAAGHRIALIVPDPEQDRGALSRALREALRDSPAVQTGCAFEFASCGPLAQQPMIAAALDTLRLAAGPLPLERVSALLLSRYFATDTAIEPDRSQESAAALPADESAARAEFDAFDLRKHLRLRPEITLEVLQNELRASTRSRHLPLLRRALRRLTKQLARPGAAQRSYGDWAEGMRKLLRAAGWGARPANETSAERHLHTLWDSTLDAIATLDFGGGRVPFEGALGALTRLASRSVYTPESAGAPIQILSPREAEGCTFDAVWCLRAGESSWPGEARSNPLLPWELQRELRMPSGDRERDRERADDTLKRIRASAPEVVFSFSAQMAEGTQRAVAAVRAMHLSACSAMQTPQGRPRVELEAVADSARIPPLPDRVHPGGAQILEAQAACGFRAFAEHRLWSTPLRETAPGMDRGRRGTVVHHALEHLWAEMQSQERLRAMTEADRRRALERAADHALARSRAAETIGWDRAYLDVQRARLLRLLATWLEVELHRPAFTVELQERELEDARIGPLRLRLRIDRVDRVGDARVLIDYKTGNAATSGWSGARPDAPQVPLYAVLSSRSAAGDGETTDSRLGAVAFASVHAGSGAHLRGVAEREGLLPGRAAAMEAESFAAQIERWHGVLEDLAVEFASGDAAVRPKLYPATCRRCAQRLLCRLDAADLDEMESEETAAREAVDG